MRACQPKDSKRGVEECEGEGKRESESEREREREHARTQERKREEKCFGSSFYMFFPPPGPAL